MKILFLTSSISRSSGGIFEVERRLAQTLTTEFGVEVSVLGLEDEHTSADLPLWLPLYPQVCRVSGPKAFGYSSQMRIATRQSKADLAHLHALWMYPSVALSHWRRRKGKPCVISLNGMLEPWALRNSSWKKRIALVLFERENLEKAGCIHVLSMAEYKSVRSFGLKNPIAIIPNGIDLPEISGQKEDGRNSPWHGYIEPGCKVLLYLGRIHPKKGLVNLLKAWAEVQRAESRGQRTSHEWILAIAGWDQGRHEAELKALARELGLSFADVRDQKTQQSEAGEQFSVLCRPISLVFLGPQFGDAKAACYANCAAFILPSFSEGLPMVVLEAWAYGKPVLMTPECNLPEGFAANAAIRIEPNVESITQGLHDLFRLPPSSLRNLGENGRHLVSARFTWPKIALEMKSVYDWALGGGEKPSSVAEY